MWAGGTKVLLGWERASRGDFAGRTLLLDLEADLARREVRLRVGAMIVGVVGGLGVDGGSVGSFFGKVLGIIWRFGGAEAGKESRLPNSRREAYSHFVL